MPSRRGCTPRTPREAWCLRGVRSRSCLQPLWLPASPSGYPWSSEGRPGCRGIPLVPSDSLLISPRSLHVYSSLPLVAGCWIIVPLTGQVALACVNIPLCVVVWLVWQLKVSHPPGLLTPTMEISLSLFFFFLEQDVSIGEAQAHLNYRHFTRVFLEEGEE